MSFLKRLGGKGKTKESKPEKEEQPPVEAAPKQPPHKAAAFADEPDVTRKKLEYSKSHYNMTRKTSHSEDQGHAAIKSRSIEDWNSKLPALNGLATFKDVPASQRPELFTQKLKACERMFLWQDLGNGDDDPEWAEKEMKREQLVELIDYINSNSKVFSEDNMAVVMEFVSVNMFRGFIANPLPPHVEYDPEEDDPMAEPCWPHLQLVLEFFLRFIVSLDVDPKTARKYIDQAFITKLLFLFDSEDSRERDFLKTILHRIYGKFMQHRAFIRKSINNVFYHFVYNTGRHNGIAELLEILGSIINGFALPLKDEHKSFLRQALMPLHKVKHMSIYHPQLSYCITQFCEKDARLTVEIIQGLLRFWPITNSSKEVLFLNEIEEILEVTPETEFDALITPLFSRINQCIMSMHFQVAERALYLFHADYMSSHINQFRRKILPVIFPGLMANTKSHWNMTVHQLTIHVVKNFNDIDPPLFEECSRKYKASVAEKNRQRSQLQLQWQAIEQTALQAPHSENWVPPKVSGYPETVQEAYELDPSKLQASLALNLPLRGSTKGRTLS